MDKVTAGTTNYVTVSFYDKNGALQAPTSATWTAIDLETGTVKQAVTALTPATSVEITVPLTVNSMVSLENAEETRRIIVVATYAGSEGLVGIYDYILVNPQKVG